MAGWVKEDLARKITQAQADVVFGELNTPMEDRVTKDDTRSEEVKLIDTHFPAAKPEEFSIPYFTPGQAPPVMPKELQQFDQSARTWLAGAQFDRTLGNSLVTTISRVAQHTKTMTPDQLDTYGEN